jgi:hypothetical protein
MKKISHLFKILISVLLKTITAMLIGLGSSFGKNPALEEKKNNKTIETNK